MKTCSKCNLSYDDDKKFCRKCGGSLISEYQIDPKEIAKKTVLEDRLKVDPLSLELLHEYAQFLFNNLLFKESITVSLKILALNEKDITAQELLFKSYNKLKLYKDASEIGEKLHTENPTDIFLLEELANLAKNLGNSEKAITYYDKIITLKSTDSKALYNKALILINKNQFEKVIEIFKSIYQADGPNDRIINIYVGIDKALNGDFQSSINLLNHFLIDDNIDRNDISNNRGILYFAFSLSQSRKNSLEIFQLIRKIELNILSKNYQAQDEQVLSKTLLFISEPLLNEAIAGPDALQKIEYIENTFLNTDYFTKNTNLIISEIWFNLGLKLVELKNYEKSLKFLKVSYELNPNENKYAEEYAEIKRKLEVESRKKKTKINISIITFIIVIISIFAIWAYNNFQENKAFELANEERTFSSYKSYLNKYPNGKYLKLAKERINNIIPLDIDCNVYHTVTIGTQVWMVENLKTTKYNDGTTIPNIAEKTEWNNLTIGAWCNYDNGTGNIYGKLYNWYAVNTGKLAPAGWHVATDVEWTALTTYLGGEMVGDKLKEMGTIRWLGHNEATNETGFSALPGGQRYNGNFIGGDNYGTWWSSTESEDTTAWCRMLFTDRSVGKFKYSKNYGCSVRCIRDL
ncbi:MAG: FISUMP domain-containing protein [Lentimicrobiaceae bacterium]|jgi:uncharacterized protein (TIGR02145 family)